MREGVCWQELRNELSKPLVVPRRWRIHRDVASSVDALLQAQSARKGTAELETEVRFYDAAGRMVSYVERRPL